MSWLKRHVAWAWSAILFAGLALVLLIRLGSGMLTPTDAGPPSEDRGIVGGDSDTLTASAKRIRTLQDQVATLREQLAAAQIDLALRHERIATLRQMLNTDSLTDCPVFLHDETTVRALQKIVRDARQPQGPLVSDETSLSTAASVATERLRGRLEAIRDQMDREAAAIETRVEGMRQQLHLQTDELENLRRQVNKQLQSSAAPWPARAG
jgi:chaperonin cofactor prefoldin